MDQKLISKISSIISSTQDSSYSLEEIEFAIVKLEGLLSFEKVREEQTQKQLHKTKTPDESLEEYFIKIKMNILKLESFIELLQSKKKLQKIKIDLVFSKKIALTL